MCKNNSIVLSFAQVHEQNHPLTLIAIEVLMLLNTFSLRHSEWISVLVKSLLVYNYTWYPSLSNIHRNAMNNGRRVIKNLAYFIWSAKAALQVLIPHYKTIPWHKFWWGKILTIFWRHNFPYQIFPLGITDVVLATVLSIFYSSIFLNADSSIFSLVKNLFYFGIMKIITVWHQIFVVQYFRNFRNNQTVMKLFTTNI